MENSTASTINSTVSHEEYQKLLEELKRTRERLSYFEALVDNIPLPIFAKNEDGRHCVANKAYEAFFACKREDLYEKTLMDLDIFPISEAQALHDGDLDIIQNQLTAHYEKTYEVAQASIPVLYWGRGFTVLETGTKGLVSVMVDISEQKELEAALEKSVQQLQHAQQDTRVANDRMGLMLDTMPIAAQIWSKDLKLIDASLVSAKLFEFNSKEHFLSDFLNIHPEYQPDGMKSIDAVYYLLQKTLDKGFVRTEWFHIDRNNCRVPLELTFQRKYLHGEAVILVFIEDLRERYANAEKLQEAYDYTRLMLETNPLGTLIWNKNSNLVHCNKVLAKTFGLEEEKEFVENFYDLIPEYQPDGSLSIEILEHHLKEAFTHGSSQCSWLGQSVTGELIPCEVVLIRTLYRGEFMVTCYVKDLREIEAQKQQLQKAEQRTNAILNGVPLGINLLTPKWELIDCNEKACEIINHQNKQDYIDNFSEIFPEIQPTGQTTQTLIEDIMVRAKQYGQCHLEMMIYNAQGKELPIEVTVVNAHLEHEELFISYVNDLTQVKQMLKEIEMSKEAAEESAKAKSDFLANMSHEIRTPMNGILGLLHLLSGTELSEAQKDFLQKALFSTNELLRIINDILDFSKIEAGKLEMEFLPFCIHDICSELESLLGHTLRKKGLAFQLYEGEFPSTVLMGDSLRLKQVLLNLLGNAIKFTSEGSVSLIIESHQEKDNFMHFKFSIKDTGIGLSAEQVSGLFNAFTQADSSVTRKYGGTGLGLAISKRIVEMMNGEIWVESTMGQGSTFHFTTIFTIGDDQDILVEQVELPALTEQKTRSGHFLLVEDNLINQLIAEELLKNAGFTLDVVNNGQEALDILEQNSYDLVLMDIQMPIMDGLTATRKIREIPKFAKLPIIAMSAHAMSGDKEKSIEHGMNDHITKPISPSVLYNTLDYWLNKKEN